MLKASDVDIDDIVGVVLYKGDWRIFAALVVDWVLCYSSYNPARASAAKESDFRQGVVDVTDENVEQYLRYLSQYEVPHTEVQKAAQAGRAWPLEIIVDFDTKTFVNGFREIRLDLHVPPEWEAYEDDPYKYVPKEIKDLWTGPF